MLDDYFALLVSSEVGLPLAAVWGALWGSFLNVVIERLPRGESLLRPGSHCMRCGAPIRFYDNIPILSYLILRGRCRACGARYSARYAVVELLGACLSVVAFLHVARSGSLSPSVQLATVLLEFFFCLGLLAIVFIDARTMIIPDAITLPMLVLLPVVAVVLGRLSARSALLGAGVGFGVVWALRELWWRLRGEEGIGLGDAKLLAVVGGVLGWQALPWVLLLGSVQGLVVAIPLRLLGKSVVPDAPYQGTAVRGVPRRPGPPAVEPAAGAEVAHPAQGEPAGAPDRGEEAPPGAREPGAQTKAGADGAAPDGEAAGGEDPALVVDEIRADAVPFGPFLALAAMEVLFLDAHLARLVGWWLGSEV